MASKITGAQVEYDPTAPLIDVDTAIEDLAEDLSRAGRRRQLIALQHLCSVAKQVYGPWHVFEIDGAWRPQREVERYDYDNRIIELVPLEDRDKSIEDTARAEGIEPIEKPEMP